MSRTKKLIVWTLLAIPAFVLAGDLALAGKRSATRSATVATSSL